MRDFSKAIGEYCVPICPPAPARSRESIKCHLPAPPPLEKVLVVPCPPPDAFRLANKLLHMYSGHFSNCCFCLSPRMSGSPFKPFKKSISDPYSLLKTLDLGPVGFQSQAIWGPHLSGANPKGWGARCGAQPPQPSGRSSGLARSLWIIGHWARGRVFGKTTSLPLLSHCGPFILCCGQAVQLVSGSFSVGGVPYEALDLVCLWEEVSSGSCYTTIMDHPLWGQSFLTNKLQLIY